MQLELWVILTVAIAAAAGFAVMTVLLIGVHGEVRRMTKAAEGAQRALQGSLRQALESTPPRAVDIPILTPAPVKLEPLPVARVPDEPSGWTAERRLLVMRLSARGKPPDQIAAALRIPEEEIDLFLKVNNLAPA